jgi:hypothetical protein
MAQATYSNYMFDFLIFCLFVLVVGHNTLNLEVFLSNTVCFFLVPLLKYICGWPCIPESDDEDGSCDSDSDIYSDSGIRTLKTVAVTMTEMTVATMEMIDVSVSRCH